MNEDLTSLWQRVRGPVRHTSEIRLSVTDQVQSSELGLDSMAEAVGRICEVAHSARSELID